MRITRLASSIFLVFMGLVPAAARAQTLDCPGVPSGQADAARLSVSIVPQLPPLELFRRWSLVLKKISEQTGLCFSLTVLRTIPEFESQFLKGGTDLVFLNPYHQVMAHRAQGYIPILADEQPLTGILVVRRDSPIATIKDLSGQALAFPSPNAFAASLLIRALLADAKVAFVPQYVQSHNNVYRSVATANTAAGGGVNNTLQREPAALQDALRVLYETPGFRSHPLSAHPRVAVRQRELIAKAFFDLASTEEGRSLLNQIQIPKPTAVSHLKDYAPLERLGIEKFVVKAE